MARQRDCIPSSPVYQISWNSPQENSQKKTCVTDQDSVDKAQPVDLRRSTESVMSPTISSTPWRWVRDESLKLGRAIPIARSKNAESVTINISVVQYDNPDRISLLDCYLKRDLITNEGPLDSVIFFAGPGLSLSDSQALDDLISSSPHYIRHNISTSPSPNLPTLLPLIAEKATLYITIPSTTVYIRPHALTRLINSKRAHPTQHLAIANSITAHLAPRHLNPTSSPDPSPLTRTRRRRKWHPSTLRTVSDPPLDAETFINGATPPSVQGYRSLLWSRLVANTRHHALSPYQNDLEEEDSRTRDARIHAAFLTSLALSRLDPWVLRSRPMAPATSANTGLAARTFEGAVAAVWGADVLDAGTSVWEEEVWMDGIAVVAQLDDGGAVGGTGLLERWADYGRRMVCSGLGDRGYGMGIGEGGEDGVELKR